MGSLFVARTYHIQNALRISLRVAVMPQATQFQLAFPTASSGMTGTRL